MNGNHVITLEDLIKATEQFSQLEKRGSYYDMAIHLDSVGFELEAATILLSTWNTNRFKFSVGDGPAELKKALDACREGFKSLEGQTFEEINFRRITPVIHSIYNRLSLVDGVKYTGASKLMHLKSPRLFVMWDQYIRDRYNFEAAADDYTHFLIRMQEKFLGLGWNDPTKPLTKAIDEYNYVTISIPAVQREKEKRKESSKRYAPK